VCNGDGSHTRKITQRRRGKAARIKVAEKRGKRDEGHDSTVGTWT